MAQNNNMHLDAYFASGVGICKSAGSNRPLAVIARPENRTFKGRHERLAVGESARLRGWSLRPTSRLSSLQDHQLASNMHQDCGVDCDGGSETERVA